MKEAKIAKTVEARKIKEINRTFRTVESFIKGWSLGFQSSTTIRGGRERGSQTGNIHQEVAL